MAPHTTFGHLNTTTLTNDSPMAHPLVLATMAFPIFCGTKDFLAKEAIHFRLQCTIVNGFRFGDFTNYMTIG
ncbi:MAG: hypothetical protein TH68_08930 [Candidatus Synechococcus spongiarum 142]|uniref:Uncharacterized protein n=1 Tax=Candidatus Synechococcus spongiarum 142 TaxID=1608213 RepID=A0A6N3X3A6_9SYNE|nr:MAG: hypothetical protein TH68_08930 [Candidatus Synechococcus spongiarum 142]